MRFFPPVPYKPRCMLARDATVNEWGMNDRKWIPAGASASFPPPFETTRMGEEKCILLTESHERTWVGEENLPSERQQGGRGNAVLSQQVGNHDDHITAAYRTHKLLIGKHRVR